MQTIDEYIEKIKRLSATIQNDRPRIALAASFDLSATIKLRIQEDGQNYNNQPFSPYTPQYAKVRNRQGYQTEKVDFTKTGRLMANTFPRVTANSQDQTIIEIAPTSAAEIAKLRGQIRKRGNILRPSQQEINAISAQYSKAILGLIKTGL